MKTYNLTSGSLHRRLGDMDCFCVLGIFAEEKAYEGAAKAMAYEVFRMEKHKEALDAMAKFLLPLYRADEWSQEWESNYEVVYRANDIANGGCPCGLDHGGDQPIAFVVPTEKIKEALALAGIEVELNDMRGKEYA